MTPSTIHRMFMLYYKYRLHYNNLQLYLNKVRTISNNLYIGQYPSESVNFQEKNLGTNICSIPLRSMSFNIKILLDQS